MDNWSGKITAFGHSTSTIQGGKLKDKDTHLHDIWFKSIPVVTFLVNSTPVLLGLTTTQERNHEITT